MNDRIRNLLHLIAWLAGAALVMAVLAGVGVCLWKCCAAITFAGLKKTMSFAVFWMFLISLIRMWWKIGSYYGRKAP